MTGEQLKVKIKNTGHSITEMAELLGMSQQSLSQALSAKDIKTGLVEKISTATSLPLSYFFDGFNGSNAIASGDFSAASIHGDATAGASPDVTVLQERIKAMQQLLDEKERLIKVLMEK